MNVLVACEESQEVCKALRAIGVNAYSCDMIPCSGGHPEWHIKGDALKALKGGTLITQDGEEINIVRWSAIIAFPPCTYLSNAGACRLFTGGILDFDRFTNGLEGKDFFMSFLEADCDYICVENPVPSKIYGLPQYSQIIQPYQHGHPYTKKTCLWLKGFPNLMPSNIIEEGITPWVSGGAKDSKGNRRKCKGKHNTKLMRSKTFPGIAKAMAQQWFEL